LDSELKVGASGVFEVAVDGKTVVKKETQAFPTEKHIVEAVARVVGQ
jgi:selenoprotein W-related protein